MREIVRKYTIAIAAALMLAALATPNMASAQEAAPEIWFIRGVVTLASGGTRNMQFMLPDQDKGGSPTLVAFHSKEQCEGARVSDPTVVGPLTMFAQIVRSRGDSVVISCEKWEHPPIKPKGEDI